MADPQHLDLTWGIVSIIIGAVGVVSASVTAFLTHVLTMAKIRKNLVDYPSLSETMLNCRKVCDLAMSELENKQKAAVLTMEQQHSMCSTSVAEKMEKQNKLLIEHTKMLSKGEDEFTALRLNFGVLIDALDITEVKKEEAKKRMDTIRSTVLNNRKP